MILLKPFLPFLVEWVEYEESKILFTGKALNSEEIEDARIAGVSHPDKIRVQGVTAIPSPGGLLSWAAKKARVFSSDTKAFTFRYGIVIREDCLNYQDNRKLYIQEFIHVGQYERYDSVQAYLVDYISECINPGYPNGPLEIQARRRSAQIVSGK